MQRGREKEGIKFYIADFTSTILLHINEIPYSVFWKRMYKKRFVCILLIINKRKVSEQKEKV